MDDPLEQRRVVRALSSRWFLAAVLLLAAALRVSHVLALRDLPLFERLILDSEHYDRWAQQIAAGAGSGQRAFYMDPLYPYVLAGLYELVGRELLLVRLLHVALGVATCGLVAVVGRRVGGALVGNVAALLMALYRPAIFNEGEIEKTALGMFLIAAALACALHDSRRARFGAGACLALAILTRGNLLLLVPLGAAWLFLTDRREARRPIALAAAFALGCAAVIVPVAWRNHDVSGEWVLTTSQAGANLYTGNNPANPTGAFQFVPFVRPHPQYEEPDFRAEAERRTGRRMTAPEVSRFWLGETLDHIARRPAFAAGVMLKKVALFWSDYELADGWDIYFLARYSWPLRIPLLGMAALMPLAVVGAYATRRRTGARLLTGYAVLYAGSTIAFFLFSRYRLHVVPAVAVLAAAGLVSIVQAAREVPVGRRLAVAGAIAALAAFSLLGTRIVGMPEYRSGDNPDQHFKLALLYQERGEPETAERLLAEAVERQPQAAPVLCGLAALYLDTQRARGAVDLFERCARSDPAFPNVWFGLGVAYQAVGLQSAAASAFARQLAITPGHVEARRQLAALPVAVR